MELYALIPTRSWSDSGCGTGDRPRVGRCQFEYCGISLVDSPAILSCSGRSPQYHYRLDVHFILSALGLVKVRKVAQRPQLVKGKTVLDDATLQVVLRYRYEVIASYTRVAERTCRKECGQNLRIYVELREEHRSDLEALQCVA